MKIAVYTICKNEEKFVDRWLKSCLDADYILVTDTGSTDGTLGKLGKSSRFYPNVHYNTVNINPWRFDDARNFSLHSIPDDIDWCICLDMDEVLTKGWREKLEALANSNYTRLRYNYVWNWIDGKPGVTYFGDKIHVRHGYRWVNPVHEVLSLDARVEENQCFIPDTLIEHHADETKYRGQYLQLLELSTIERPWDDRSAHYYARELMFNGHYRYSIEEFQRHLRLESATWSAERAASYRYMGDCCWALGQIDSAIECFKQAVQEAPDEREPLVSLAQAYRALENWPEVIKYCEKALLITEKPNSYITQPYAWSSWPEEMYHEALTEVKKTNANT